MQQQIVVVLLSVLIISCAGQLSGCSNVWICDGGDINSINFVDDNDVTITQADSFCTLVQDGSYDVKNSKQEIVLDFSGLLNQFFDCTIINEEDDRCTQDCYDDEVTFTFVSGTCQLNGPNGEVCTPATSSEECESRTCPDGQQLVIDPNNPPTTNGCGPESIPFSGPSFSFGKCCENHDLCYGACDATSKVTCDNDFYECMYCSCYDQYDSIEVDFCLEIACTYYQLVDEFGCDAFQSAQADGCICEAEKDLPRTYVGVPSKWGPAPEQAFRTRDLLCNAPFTPTSCPANSPGSSAVSSGSSGATSNGASSGSTVSSVSSGSSGSSGSSEGSITGVSIALLALVALFAF